jgi:hypothetical protein
MTVDSPKNTLTSSAFKQALMEAVARKILNHGILTFKEFKWKRTGYNSQKLTDEELQILSIVQCEDLIFIENHEYTTTWGGKQAYIQLTLTDWNGEQYIGKINGTIQMAVNWAFENEMLECFITKEPKD